MAVVCKPPGIVASEVAKISLLKVVAGAALVDLCGKLALGRVDGLLPGAVVAMARG